MFQNFYNLSIFQQNINIYKDVSKDRPHADAGVTSVLHAILSASTGGRREERNPKLRWIDDVGNYLLNCGVRDWKNAASN
jgi:hypothetical protein